MYKYPYSDENGSYTWATRGGKHIKIYKKLGLAESMKLSKKYKKDNVFENEETIQRLTNKAKEIGRLNCCKEISEEVKTIANENNIKAKVTQVTVFNKEGMLTLNGHYVTEINGALYDYTGKQFLGSNDPNDIELRIYKKVSNNYYAEDNIKIDDPEKAMDYTEKNEDKLIFYRN